MELPLICRCCRAEHAFHIRGGSGKVGKNALGEEDYCAYPSEMRSARTYTHADLSEHWVDYLNHEITATPPLTAATAWTGAVWNQLGQDLDGEAADDQSGEVVALSADGLVVAIGAYRNDPNGRLNAGHVRVYAWDGATDAWAPRGADLDGEVAGDYVGYAVALSADGVILAVAARTSDFPGKANAGHVRVYAWDGGAYVPRGQDLEGEKAGDYASAVALSADGTVVAVGAYLNDGGGTSSGHVRVHAYDATTDRWDQRGMDIDGEHADDYSGDRNVALSADGLVVAVGSSDNDGDDHPTNTNRGHARVFAWTGQAWDQRGQDLDGEAHYDLSGSDVALSADGLVVAVGAKYNDGDDHPTNSNRGHVRVFAYDASADHWGQRGADIDGQAGSDNDGSSVALSADGVIVVIGGDMASPSGKARAGHARVHVWDGAAWQAVGDALEGEDVGDYSGGAVAMSADGATIAVGARKNHGNNGALSDSGHVRVYYHPPSPQSGPTVYDCKAMCVAAADCNTIVHKPAPPSYCLLYNSALPFDANLLTPVEVLYDDVKNTYVLPAATFTNWAILCPTADHWALPNSANTGDSEVVASHQACAALCSAFSGPGERTVDGTTNVPVEPPQWSGAVVDCDAYWFQADADAADGSGTCKLYAAYPDEGTLQPGYTKSCGDYANGVPVATGNWYTRDHPLLLAGSPCPLHWTSYHSTPTGCEAYCAIAFQREGSDGTCMPGKPECANWLDDVAFPTEFVTVNTWCICGAKLEQEIAPGRYVNRGTIIENYQTAEERFAEEQALSAAEGTSITREALLYDRRLREQNKNNVTQTVQAHAREARARLLGSSWKWADATRPSISAHHGNHFDVDSACFNEITSFVTDFIPADVPCGSYMTMETPPIDLLTAGYDPANPTNALQCGDDEATPGQCCIAHRGSSEMSRVWLQGKDVAKYSVSSAFDGPTIVGTAVHTSQVAAVGNFVRRFANFKP